MLSSTASTIVHKMMMTIEKHTVLLVKANSFSSRYFILPV